MQHYFNQLITHYFEFEKWFEKNFGWFFTNGARNPMAEESEN